MQKVQAFIENVRESPRAYLTGLIAFLGIVSFGAINATVPWGYYYHHDERGVTGGAIEKEDITYRLGLKGMAFTLHNLNFQGQNSRGMSFFSPVYDQTAISSSTTCTEYYCDNCEWAGQVSIVFNVFVVAFAGFVAIADFSFLRGSNLKGYAQYAESKTVEVLLFVCAFFHVAIFSGQCYDTIKQGTRWDSNDNSVEAKVQKNMTLSTGFYLAVAEMFFSIIVLLLDCFSCGQSGQSSAKPKDAEYGVMPDDQEAQAEAKHKD
jgi:hypothetical protein